MKTQTKLMITLLSLIAFVGIAKAQTVEQVASELDNVEVDLVTVNGKADAAKSKSDANEAKTLGVEQRVTALEAAPAYDDTALASRVAALETNPVGPTQASHDALASRVTSLEAAPATVEKYVARDSLGSFVASWFDRAAVGVAFLMVNNGSEEIRVRISPDAIDWLGIRAPVNGNKTLYPYGDCSGAPMVQVSQYNPPDLSSDDFFGGYIEGKIQSESGALNVYRFDSSQVVAHTGDTFKLDGGSCQFAVRNPDVYLSIFAFTLPHFVPPFTIAQEQ